MGINWKRKIFHFLCALCLFFLSKVLKENAFLCLLAFFLVSILLWEFLRLKFPQSLPFKNLWFSLLKEREKKHLSDASFFILGIFSASLLVSNRELEFLILILGISDPLAGILGSLYGKPFFKFKKSLLGALIFLLSSFFIGIFYLKTSLFKLFLLSLVLSLIEFLTERDNLWVPLSGALYLKIL